MSEKSRYFKIGLFTFGSMVLLAVGLILFGAGALFQAPPIVAETYFTGSVQGLDVGAPVKMSGVRVGKVRDISFVRHVYGKDLEAKSLTGQYNMVYVSMELESRFFPKLQGKTKDEIQGFVDLMVKRDIFRSKLQSIGITGLLYVELGYHNPEQTPVPEQIDWKPNYLYIPSHAGVATRLGDSLEKMLNKLDTDIYPMIENLNKASKELPAMTSKINEALPYIASISKNIDDITATGKKYPSQMIFGDAPPKSRFDQ